MTTTFKEGDEVLTVDNEHSVVEQVTYLSWPSGAKLAVYDLRGLNRCYLGWQLRSARGEAQP